MRNYKSQFLFSHKNQLEIGFGHTYIHVALALYILDTLCCTLAL